jgi:hypothetical protein
VKSTLKMEINTDDIVQAIRKMEKNSRDALIEDILAATSPEYLKSIKDARADYKAGRIVNHNDLFQDDV